MIKMLRDFPAVEELLQHQELKKYVSAIPQPAAVSVIREVVATQKVAFKKAEKPLPKKKLLQIIKSSLIKAKRQEITRVINATGIVVHTNLGRAPLSDQIFESIKESVTGYCNIEFNLADGKRGQRGEAAEKYLALLSGAESATIVNNCAAALFLMLNTFANRKEVLLSRGEMIQIGGGFRIPDILKKSGAKLCEIGTTNITNLNDYESNIKEPKTALILKVHQSNFVQGGFTEEVKLKDLVTLGNKRNIPVINDLGSGVFINTRESLGINEMTVVQSVRSGAELTSFSGDKMLGGIQAGLIVGKSDYIKKIKRNPLFRAMRVDKVVFSTLERLLSYYLSNSYETNIKLWSVLKTPESELYKRGKVMLKKLHETSGISLQATKSFMGGGALPEAEMPSVGLIFSSDYNANSLSKIFRKLSLPILGRVEKDQFILDLKTIDEEDMSYLIDSINKIIDDLK